MVTRYRAPTDRGARSARGIVRLAVAGIFAASGTLHVVRPSAFDELMPPWLPEPVVVNLLAGAVELVCAYGLLTRRRWAGPASAATLLAVWPSNLQFAIAATSDGGLTSAKALLAWGRMPMQIPMIWAVLMPVGTRSPAPVADAPL